MKSQTSNPKSLIRLPQSARLIIGLMSGTSLDGIDAVLLRVSGSGISTKFTQLAFHHQSFPRGLKDILLKNSVPDSSRVDEIARLNVLLAHLYADVVRKVAAKGGKQLSRIDLIGSHGQTIQHLPKQVKMFGKDVRATFQIGDPSVLATLTGITTVGDFRLADMSVGGQGAPLVPYFDWLAFRSESRHRALLNIGGIANITALPAKCSPEDVVAFDTGPGNMVIDALMQRLYGRPFDKNGIIASSGMIIHELFDWMKGHPYLKQRPPKSTGREMFGKKFVEDILKRAGKYDREDIIATATQFTAFAVHESVRKFVRDPKVIDQLIVSGGGAKNGYIMAALREYFKAVQVRAIDEFGVSSEAKEAICFAILANECLAGNPANMPSVTGAKRRVVLGKICRPHRMER